MTSFTVGQAVRIKPMSSMVNLDPCDKIKVTTLSERRRITGKIGQVIHVCSYKEITKWVSVSIGGTAMTFLPDELEPQEGTRA